LGIGAFLGSWSKIVGYLRKRPALVWAAGVSLAAILFLTGLFYLRDADVSGSYQTYLYVEVGAHFSVSATRPTRWSGFAARTIALH